MQEVGYSLGEQERDPPRSKVRRMTPSEAKIAIDAAYDAADSVVYWMDIVGSSCFDRVPFVVEMDKEPEQLLPEAVAELKSRGDEMTSDFNHLEKSLKTFCDAMNEISDLLLYSYPAMGVFVVDGLPNKRFAYGAMEEIGRAMRSWYRAHRKYLHAVLTELEVLIATELLLSQNELRRVTSAVEPPKLPLTDEQFIAIKQRLFLERGQLYRDHVGREGLAFYSDAEGSAVDIGRSEPKPTSERLGRMNRMLREAFRKVQGFPARPSWIPDIHVKTRPDRAERD